MALSTRQIEEVAEVFRLLGEPNRLRLVLACLASPQRVGELVETLGLSQTLVSHHLRLLRSAHVLRGDRQGRQVLYAIDDEHVRDTVRNMVAHLTEPHDHRQDDHRHDDHHHDGRRHAEHRHADDVESTEA